ncbi:MAG: CerR family C-terminal domain-containing protein [Phycisphaerae bacterium]
MPKQEQHATRDRLIEAAGKLFARYGYQRTQIREICKVANVNIAAVNYHFRDKAGLYRSVLKFAHECAHDTLENMLEAIPQSATPDEKLRNFITSFLKRTLAAGRPAWHGKLVAREMIEPSPALEEFVDADIAPRFGILCGIIADCLGVAASAETVRWHAASVIAQCLFWEHNRPVIQRLYTDLEYNAEQIDFIADHVATFCINAMRVARENRARCES